MLYPQKNFKNDSLEKYSYSELRNKFYEYDNNGKTAQSKAISIYYLQKAKKEKNNLEIAEGYILKHFNENFPKALKYIDSISIVTESTKGSLYPARIYITRGNLYFKYDNLDAALDNYISGLKYAKEQNNLKLMAYANLNIAYLNNYIGKNEEAAKIFRYYLYNSNNITDEDQHHQIRVGLICCYIELSKLDSANILIKEGRKSALITKNKYSISQYDYLAGFYYLKQRKYATALPELSKAYNYFHTINDNNITNILFSIAKSYDGLNNKENAVKSFSEIDSIVQKTNNIFPELREVYTYLIDYYKEKNNKEKQLYYIDRFLKVDKKLDEQLKYLSIELPKKYENPRLLEEKENIIKDLKNRKITLYVSISIMLLILLLLSYLYYKSKKREKLQRKIAQDLIHSIEKRNIENPDTKPDIVSFQEIKETESSLKLVLPSEELEKFTENHNPHTEEFFELLENKAIKTIPEDVKQFILQELEQFEAKELFLKKGITLTSLAKSVKTNTTYLSEIINSYKGKNFAAYLNELRINYALNKLVIDKRFRSYKLSVIAEELGYNNEQAFSIAFKKKTGTPLSTYIKEIEKANIS
jgi:AraC-like DNA-binding protein